ncbi:BTAD domain-containing putative transcriptional regulator [Kitasatospora sp. NPDC056327]|uniref:AfsR/SARP family transcriptional regulator n=1 Tax=Kitasatospora sp. NPDC056327 TaxID=3345785 RepID=UPI0035DB03C0
MVKVRMLGPLSVLVGDRSADLPGGRARVVLGVLALRWGRFVPVEHLVDAAWPDAPPATARAQVQAQVSALRRALDAAGAPGGLLATRGGGYLLDAAAGDRDLDEFRRLVAQGRTAAAEGRAEEAVVFFRAGLALWQGAAFGDLTSPYLRDAATGLEESRLLVLEELAAAELALGRHAEVVVELSELVALYPLREHPVGLLMLALYRSGRRADALAAHRDLRRRLVDELGVEPGDRLRDLHRRILADDPSLAAPAVPAAPTAAPVPATPPVAPAEPGAPGEPADPAAPPAPPGRPAVAGRTGRRPCARPENHDLYGREDDVSEVTDLLGRHRLVTLVGSPGVGKSRLARRIASLPALVDGPPDGAAGAHGPAEGAGGPVWIVEVDTLTDPAGVPAAVATAVGVRAGSAEPARTTLARHLGTAGPALLVLDGCEPVLDACAALVDSLLDSCPDLVVLATTREPLAVSGETLWQVHPLAVPDSADPDVVRCSPAAQLFVARATAKAPGFRFSMDDAPLVARVCQAVEGLPLALELAAAQLRSASLPELVERLADGQTVLLSRRRAHPARHRSLTAAIDWSHELLTAREQRVLAGLAVFRGDFAPDAAQEVLAGPGLPAAAVADAVRGLVECSLVGAATADGSTRYRLLEPVRQFAQDRLEESGLAGGAADRHAGYYCRLAERTTAPGVPRPDGGHEAVVRREAANIRAALHWSLGSPDPATGLRLVGALAWYWCGLPAEGQDWVRRALTRLDEAPPALRQRVWFAAGQISTSSDLDSAAGYLARAAADAAEAGMAGAESEALCRLSMVRYLQGHAPEAHATAREVLARTLPSGDRFAIAQLELVVGMTAVAVGDLDTARSRLRSAAEAFERHGDAPWLASVHWAQAELAHFAGDPHGAVAKSLAAMRSSAYGTDLYATTYLREQAARCAYAAGDREAAVGWLRQALRSCLDHGILVPAVDAVATAARLEADSGRFGRAAVLWAGVAELRAVTGRRPTPAEEPSVAEFAALLHSRLPGPAHEEALRAGGGLTAGQVIARALAAVSREPEGV